VEPDHFFARLGLVWALALDGDMGAAAAQAARFSPEEEKHPSVLLAKGLFGFQSGNLDAATLNLREVRNFWPDNALANLMLSAIHLSEGGLEQAETLARRVIADYPGLPAPQLLLAAIRMERGQPDVAAEGLEDTLRRSPAN